MVYLTWEEKDNLNIQTFLHLRAETDWTGFRPRRMVVQDAQWGREAVPEVLAEYSYRSQRKAAAIRSEV
jgi:hypothetical protein